MTCRKSHSRVQKHRWLQIIAHISRILHTSRTGRTFRIYIAHLTYLIYAQADATQAVQDARQAGGIDLSAAAAGVVGGVATRERPNPRHLADPLNSSVPILAVFTPQNYHFLHDDDEDEDLAFTTERPEHKTSNASNLSKTSNISKTSNTSKTRRKGNKPQEPFLSCPSHMRTIYNDDHDLIHDLMRDNKTHTAASYAGGVVAGVANAAKGITVKHYEDLTTGGDEDEDDFTTDDNDSTTRKDRGKREKKNTSVKDVKDDYAEKYRHSYNPFTDPSLNPP